MHQLHEDRRASASCHAVVLLLTALLSAAWPSGAEGQELASVNDRPAASSGGETASDVPDPPSDLAAPRRPAAATALPPLPLPPPASEPAEDTGSGYRRAVRLYGFASALTTLALVGVGVGIATLDSCGSSSFCIDQGPVFLTAAGVVGLHGIILFIIAGVVHGKAARREAELERNAPTAALDVDVQVSPEAAGLVLSGSF